MSMKSIHFPPSVADDMVRAILDNLKTVTRRAVKPQHLRVLDSPYRKEHPETPDNVLIEKLCEPPYHPGDILYVRETFCWCPCWDCGMNTEEGCVDETAEKFYNDQKAEWGCYGYKASFADNEAPFGDGWNPSIHMPREAARIFLRVTDVRAQQLKDITEADALREGFCSRASLVAELLKMHPDCTEYSWLWGIEFERISREEAMQNA